MNTKIIFLRNIDLSDTGFQKTIDLGYSSILPDAQVIYTSSELKNYQTITSLAQKLNLNIIQSGNLDDIRKSERLLTDKEFELEKIKQLEDLNYPAFGGETAINALKRFADEIKKIQDENIGKTVIVVSNDTILNLYFAKLQNNFNEIVDRWRNTEFGAIGIIENGKVIKDLVEIKEYYPNIEKFLRELGLEVTYSIKTKIVFKFIDDRELVISEDDFITVQENLNSTEEDFNRVWGIKHKLEKLFFPKLRPLIEKLNQFYENRDTTYKHQVFLYAPSLEVLKLSPINLAFEYFKVDKNYTDKIFKELKDFDKFLEN